MQAEISVGKYGFGKAFQDLVAYLCVCIFTWYFALIFS